MTANLANSAEATGQERSVFIPIAKKSNAREYLDYCTIVLISEASKILLKVLQDRFQQYMNCKLPGVKPGFRKGVGTSDQIAYLCRIIEKARKKKKIYLSFIDSAKVFGCVDHSKLWNILQEMGMPDHNACLLRNQYTGQEVTVRTWHGTTDWFQVGKGVHQGCILYAAYLTYIQSKSCKMPG